MKLAFDRHPCTTATGGAPTIVLLHGLGGSRRVWAPLLDELRTRADVIAIDLPGFGGSRRPREQWSMEEAADSILETLDALDVEQFVIVGHSMGGAAAIVLADRAPHRVVGIGLVCAAGFWGRGSGAVSAQTELLHTAWRGAVRVSGPLVLHSPALRERVFGTFVADPSRVDASLARMFSRDVSRARSSVAARAALFAVDLMPVAARLDMPAQLIWGARDRLVPVSVGRQLHACMRGSELSVLPDVGHLPIWEAPEATAAALTSLLDRVSTPTG